MDQQPVTYGSGYANPEELDAEGIPKPMERSSLLEREIAAFRSILEEHSKMLKALQESASDRGNRDDETHMMLLATQEQLLRRVNMVQASIMEIRIGGSQPESVPTVPGDISTTPLFEQEGPVDYQQLIIRILLTVRATVPPSATVIVVSRGDDHLLQLDGRTAWHFPQSEGGAYAGHHPADSAAAIAELEKLRIKGGNYLLLPYTAFWWLDYYTEFRRHLQAHHQLTIDQEQTCKIFLLEPNLPSVT